jgi:hypothetical protein
MDFMTVRIHPTALIESDVTIGSGTSVWNNVHIRHSTQIGEDCIIGEKTYIAYGVRIGDRWSTYLNFLQERNLTITLFVVGQDAAGSAGALPYPSRSDSELCDRASFVDVCYDSGHCYNDDLQIRFNSCFEKIHLGYNPTPKK